MEYEFKPSLTEKPSSIDVRDYARMYVSCNPIFDPVKPIQFKFVYGALGRRYSTHISAETYESVKPYVDHYSQYLK